MENSGVRKDLEVRTGEMRVMMSEKREIVKIMRPGKKKEEKEIEIVMIAMNVISLAEIIGEIALCGVKNIIQMMITMKLGLRFHTDIGTTVIINFVYNGQAQYSFNKCARTWICW